MINKLLRELKKNVQEIYGVHKITPAIIFHHGIKNYQENIKLIEKYCPDTDKLLLNLLSFIRTQDVAPAVKQQPSPRGLQSFLINGHQINLDDFGFSDFFQDPRFDQPRDNMEILLQKIINNGMQFDLQKSLQDFQKNPALGKQPSQPTDVSFSSFLRALFNLAEGTNIYFTELADVFIKSGFEIEKFITDFHNAEVDRKSIIEELCENLNKSVMEGKILPAIARDKEISEVINILKKARKNNPILVGKAGVGKTAIAEGLAWLIVNKKVPKYLEKAVVYNLQVMDMVKGTSYRGQFEEKMSNLLKDFKELEKSGKQIPILFIDEIHTIMGSGNANGLDFANIIKPALARGELRTIGATTTDEWHQFIKSNPALDRRLVPVTVKEPTKEDTFTILSRSIGFYEKMHGVKYSDEVIKRAIDLTDEFVNDNAFPDKAFDLIDFTGAMNNIRGKTSVESDDIEEALSKQKNVDLNAIKSKKDLKTPLSEKLKANLFGQDEIIDKVSRSIEKSLAGLGHKDKPMGSFLFLGQTGTGKTQLAKDIAKTINAHFHRIDMSEFMEAHSISKLIGSPPGYVGFEEGSPLTKVLLENPRTVLLLDEVEKAHPHVKNIFLQAMDNAKITDSKGKEISFRNVLMIFTSNAGAEHFESKTVGLTPKVNISKVDASMKTFFTPEFRARLTGNAPVYFNPMTKNLLVKIANKEIDLLIKERLEGKNIVLKIDKSVINHIVDEAEQMRLGARPVKDLIESLIVEELSEIILYDKKYKENLESGDSTTIKASLTKDNKVKFTVS